MRNDEIARVCYAANKALGAILGEGRGLSWDECGVEKKVSFMNGVRYALADPWKMSPQRIHEEWMVDKMVKGWKYGLEEKVEGDIHYHPCMLNWEDLPPEQKLKDVLFLAIVNALQ